MTLALSIFSDFPEEFLIKRKINLKEFLQEKKLHSK